MPKCFICSKGKVYGVSHTHHRGVAGGQWKKKAPKTQKIFKPNLQKYHGEWYCTRCLRMVKKTIKPAPKVSPVPKTA